MANSRGTPSIPDFDETRDRASFEETGEDVEQAPVVDVAMHHPLPRQPMRQRSREQSLDDRLVKVREKVNGLRALLAVLPEPKIEEEAQSQPGAVWGRHAGTETEASSYLDELHQPEAVPWQIVAQPSENGGIHLDRGVCSSPAANSPRVNSQWPSDSSIKLARELHDRINSFIQTGASTSVAHALTGACKSFLRENSPADVCNHALPSSW